jgi:hypothetical protein
LLSPLRGWPRLIPQVVDPPLRGWRDRITPEHQGARRFFPRYHHDYSIRCTSTGDEIPRRRARLRRTRARRNIRATNPLRRRRRKSTTHLRYHHDYSIRCTTATRSRTSRSGHSEIPTKDSRLYYVKPPSAGRSRAHQPITVFYYFSTASLLGFFIGPTSQLQIHISCVFLGHHPA